MSELSRGALFVARLERRFHSRLKLLVGFFLFWLFGQFVFSY